MSKIFCATQTLNHLLGNGKWAAWLSTPCRT